MDNLSHTERFFNAFKLVHRIDNPSKENLIELQVSAEVLEEYSILMVAGLCDELAERENESDIVDSHLKNMIFPAIKELAVLALIAKEGRCIAQGGRNASS